MKAIYLSLAFIAQIEVFLFQSEIRRKAIYIMNISLHLMVLIKWLLHFAVGITWDDAPIEQNAVIHRDYKIRCVVRASPPATIDWLKESLIISTGKCFF